MLALMVNCTQCNDIALSGSANPWTDHGHLPYLKKKFFGGSHLTLLVWHFLLCQGEKGTFQSGASVVNRNKSGSESVLSYSHKYEMSLCSCHLAVYNRPSRRKWWDTCILKIKGYSGYMGHSSWGYVVRCWQKRITGNLTESLTEPIILLNFLHWLPLPCHSKLNSSASGDSLSCIWPLTRPPPTLWSHDWRSSPEALRAALLRV